MVLPKRGLKSFWSRHSTFFSRLSCRIHHASPGVKVYVEADDPPVSIRQVMMENRLKASVADIPVRGRRQERKKEEENRRLEQKRRSYLFKHSAAFIPCRGDLDRVERPR